MSDFYVSGKKILTPEDIYMTNQEITDANWNQKRNIHHLQQENGYFFDLYATDWTSWGVTQNHYAVQQLSQEIANRVTSLLNHIAGYTTSTVMEVA